MQELTTTTNTALSAELVAAAERASNYVEASKSANTRRAYANAWRCFSGWCAANGLVDLPASPSTVGLYLAAKANDGLKAASLELRLASISSAHRAAGHALDTGALQIRDVMRGIRRVHGTAQTKKAAATKDVLRDSIRAYASDDTRKAKRDRALLAIGFYAALRRSELAAITVADIQITPDGIVLTLPRRKTDQDGAGTTLGLPAKDDPVTCPVQALRAWLDASGITDGPIFRSVNRGDRVLANQLSDKDVARVVKAAVSAAGYNPDDFGGHSLRSGFITSAVRAGVTERVIMAQSGHKRIDELHGYVRRAGLFSENAAAMV